MRELLPRREFRLLFVGQGLSTIGDRIVFVALALYVTDIGTPSDVGVVLAAHASRWSASCSSAAYGPTGCRGTWSSSRPTSSASRCTRCSPC